jgi:hypothetical protein
VTTCGHNLQRSFALLLADNIAQILAFIRRLFRRASDVALEKSAHFLQMVGDRQSLPPISPTSAALSEETTMRRRL